MDTRGLQAREPVRTEELFRAHAPFVARLLGRLGVPADELDDAVQEVFLVVHRNGGYLPGPATPTGYLTSIALRVASTHRRRGRKRRERRSEVAPDDVSSSSLDPARSLEVHQSLTELQHALDELEPDMRATLVLAELEGESCLSIAATMQTPVGTVYWRLHRARKSFRAAIESRRVAERRPETVAAGTLLFGRPAESLLDAGRADRGAAFDVEAALERLRSALRSGASIPPWASTATHAGLASGVGLTAPAILSALVFVHAVGTGMSHWRGDKARAESHVAAASLVSVAPVPVVAPDIPVGAPQADLPDTNANAAGEPSPALATAAPGRHSPLHRVSREDVAAPSALTSPRAFIPPADPTAGDPSPEADPQAPDALREIQDVAEAQRLLTTDPARALALVRAIEAGGRSGYLREERRYMGTMALFRLGRLDEARNEAARFLADYPDGPYSARVRAAR